MLIELDLVLGEIERHALECSEKAEVACKRSKHSIAEYWVCVENRLQQLHDSTATRFGSSRKCQHSTFRQKLNDFRKTL